MFDCNKIYHAQLNIVFLIVQQIALFTHISIDGEIFSTQNEIDMRLQFDDLEIELGKKVCFIELFYFKMGKKITQTSYIEVYPGYNKVYCFLDIIEGTTYESIFYRKDMKTFIKSKFNIYIKSCDKKIPITLNTMGLNDRANLILINCLNSSNLLVDNKRLIDFGKAITEIPNFYHTNSYFLFFNNNDFEKIISRELIPIKRLNFEDIYNKNYRKAEDMYNSIMLFIPKKGEGQDANLFQKEDTDIFKDNFKKISNFYGDLIHIMYNNYVFPKSILTKELNESKYINFIYKIVVFAYIKRESEKDKNISLSDIKDIIDKLKNSYEKILKDEDLENSEKILLLINIYLSQLFKYDKEIKYLKINKVDKESPLALSIKFLNEFIEELDYESQFYYPLLLIDGGLFNFKYKYDFWFRTFGANMNTLEYIKIHLKNLIPNTIIISDKCKNENIDDYGYVMQQIGLVTLNIKLLGNDIHIEKKNEKERKQKAFIIFRVLFHELFAHKKSSLSKDYIGENHLSANCFKDELDDKFKFLPDYNNDDIFKDIDELNIQDIDKSTGDSGYFLEYYFGKVKNEYIVDILDDYENKMNLGILLDVNLLHKRINEFKHYIELSKYMIDNKINMLINNNNLKDQIEQMERIIAENRKTTENKNPTAPKINYNFFNENKNAFNEIKNEKNKRKKKLHKDSSSNNKIVQLNNLFNEAFHPFNFEKILELEEKYPRAFCKK